MVRISTLPLVASIATLLLPSQAAAVVSPAYQGLGYAERPVATVAVLPGVSVNTLSGNLLLARGLLTVPGRGVPLEAYLVYNSDRRRIASPFGKGWTFSYSLRYVIDGAGNVSIVWGDGRVDRFPAAGGGAFTSPDGVFATLSSPAAGQLALRTKLGMEYRFFNAVHRKLTAIADPHGNTLTLTYDAAGRLTRITDASTRVWDLGYDALGRVVTFTDPDLPRTFTLTYDAAHRLVSLMDPRGESEGFAYGADDLLTAITDRRGNTAAVAYTGPLGPEGSRLVASIGQGGSTTAFAYEPPSRSTTVTDPNGGDWIYQYSVTDLLAWSIDPSGGAAGYAWSPDRLLVKLTDRRGTESSYEYDGNGNLTKSTVPLVGLTNAVTTITYNPTCNRPATVQDPRGNTWTYSYDASCNLLSITDPAALGGSAAIAYDAFGQPTQVTDRSGRVTTLGYDPDGNLVGVTDALFNHEELHWDRFGRLIRTEDALGNERTFDYDALSRLVSATDALGQSASYEYDAAGNLVRFIDREGNQTRASYDALGRLAGTTDAIDNFDVYTYDAAGNPTAYLDRRGNTWTQVFNLRGEPTSVSNPLGGTWSIAYDANGNVVTSTDAKGQVTTFAYDLANRLVQRDTASGARTTYTYDANSNLLTAVDRVSPGGTITSNLSFLYDAANRKTRSTDNLLSRFVAKTWDGDGRQLTEVDGIGNATSYQYDAAGRLFRITSYAGTATYTLDAAGNELLDQRSNGVSASYSYDANNRVASLAIRGPASPAPSSMAALDPGGPVLGAFTYTRDGNGDIVAALRETGENVAFTRDGLRRIVTESGTLGGAYTQSFGYDANGNRLNSTLFKAGFTRTISESFDAANRAVTYSNLINGAGPSATYTLDLNGSRTLASYSGGSSTTYTYNDRNLLTAFNAGGGNAASYAWDALDRIYGRTGGGSTMRFLYGSPVVSAFLLVGGFPSAVYNLAWRPVRITNVRPNAACCGTPGGVALVPLKIAESISPRPTDRVFLNYSYFSDPATHRLPFIDYQGTGLHLFDGQNFTPFLPARATTGSGSSTAFLDRFRDAYFTRSASGNTFAQIPQITYPLPGSTSFAGDDITFFGSIAFNPVTGSLITSSNFPSPGAGAVNRSFTPLSTAAPGGASAPIPRFADTGTASNLLSINPCLTNLLFPFVTNQVGFDTGLAISTTSGDFFGTPVQTGTCTTNAYGGTTFVAPAPTIYTTLDSTPNFQGYLIARCSFQYAHGFAFISDFGAQRLAQGYLALVLDDAGAPTTAAPNEGLGH